MKKNVSKQKLTIYKCVKDANGWISTQQIAENTNLQKCSINRHLKYLVESNVLELLEVFKEETFHLYRVSSDETNEIPEVKRELEQLLALSLATTRKKD